MNRFETQFGKDGWTDGVGVQHLGRLKPFAASYRFKGHTWGIIVWAYDWSDARNYARWHGLRIDGEIDSIIPA